MTIRLFRRKAGGSGNASSQDAAPATQPSATDDTKRPSRRRGGGSSAKRTSTESALPPAIVPPEPDQAPAQRTGRTRRGRRGGARRKAAQPAGATASAIAAPIAPPEVLPIDGRPATLEQLIEAQLHVMRGLQVSLASIDSRLGSLAKIGTEQPRIGIFVDVPNIMYAAERLKITLDYSKLLQLLLRGRELIRANAYAPISDDPQEPLQTQKFVQPFIGHGYSLVTKPLKRYTDGSIKANFDVEMALDVLVMSDRLDTVVLVSGDSDFRRVVELVASKGVRVEVAAFGDSTSIELRAAADEYIDIKEHVAELRTK
jgi:uncharacterized LabA/DUF88 family protein